MKKSLMNCAICAFIGMYSTDANAAQPNTTGNPPGEASASPPSVTPASEVSSGGCVGRKLDECLAYVEHAITIESVGDNVEEQRQNNKRTDVNGKRLSKFLRVSLFGHLPGFESRQGQLVVIEYDMSDTVTNVSVTLPSDPESAESEEEYAKTALYEGVKLLFGSACPASDRMSVYRFFQNDVKPKVKHEGKDIEVGMTSASETYAGSAKGIPFCGRTFDYSYSYGTDTENISESNEHGFSSMYMIIASSARVPASTPNTPAHKAALKSH